MKGGERMKLHQVLVLGFMTAVTGVMALAPHAWATHTTCPVGWFCAYDHAGYHDELLRSAAPRGRNGINVANDRVSSGRNRTANTWVGITQRTVLPDQTVFRFGPFTNVSNVGPAANDKIDHFNVR
jgi:Peptidase inhibitor family I36